MRSAGSILALSVTCGDSSPKGRALGMAVSFPVELQSVRVRQSLSLWERWHCVSNDGEGEPAALRSRTPSVIACVKAVSEGANCQFAKKVTIFS